MARRKVEVKFDGDVEGLRRSAAVADRSLEKVGRSARKQHAPLAVFGNEAGRLGRALGMLSGPLGRFGGPLALGPIGLLIQAIAGAARAVAQLSGALLALPAIMFAVIGIFAVAKLAFTNFGDAVSASSPEEWATATRGMGRETVAAVREIRRMRPEMRALRTLVQEEFWRGFVTDVRGLTDIYLPILSTQLPKIAAGLATWRTRLAEMLKTPATSAAIDLILARTAELTELASDALAEFLRGLITLGARGSGVLPRLGRWLSDIATAFADWTENTEEIEHWIDRGIQGFKDLGASLLNIYHIFTTILFGLSGPQQDPLRSLREGTARYLAMLREPKNQAAITAIGQGLKELGQLVVKLWGAVGGTMIPAIAAIMPLLVQLGQGIVSILVPAFQQIGPPLIKIIQHLVPLLIPALAAIGHIISTYIVPAVATLVGWLEKAIGALVAFGKGAAQISSATGGGGSGGGFFSAIGSFFGGLFGRARGGELQARGTYLVGENGPEIISMGNRGGMATPAGLGMMQPVIIVRIGETELRQLVGSEIVSWETGTARAVYAGAA